MDLLNLSKIIFGEFVHTSKMDMHLVTEHTFKVLAIIRCVYEAQK